MKDASRIGLVREPAHLPAARASAQVRAAEGKTRSAWVPQLDDAPRMLAQRQRIEGIGAAAPNRTGLPDSLKAGIEHLSGMDLSDVRVHANSSKPAQLNALAYAQGSDIHVAPGQERHLPHEAWHVVQQRQGRVQPTLQMAGVPVNDDTALESEADAMGVKALQMQQASSGSTLQRKCRDCDEENKNGKGGSPAQLRTSGTVVQRECNTTNRGGDQLHDYVVNHMVDAKGWGKEYQVRQGGPAAALAYADLVTPAATRVYEVKSTGVGAAVAAAEAAQYAGWMTTRCQNTQVGTWAGYEHFDMGDLGQACIRGHGNGGITYLRDETGANCNTLL